MIFQTWKVSTLNSMTFQTFPGSVRTLSQAPAASAAGQVDNTWSYFIQLVNEEFSADWSSAISYNVVAICDMCATWWDNSRCRRSRETSACYTEVGTVAVFCSSWAHETCVWCQPQSKYLSTQCWWCCDFDNSSDRSLSATVMCRLPCRVVEVSGKVWKQHRLVCSSDILCRMFLYRRHQSISWWFGYSRLCEKTSCLTSWRCTEDSIFNTFHTK